MVKKGKFKLLSYLIEEDLIFYKSLGKNEKFIAFALIEIKSFNILITLLIEFLKKKFIHYFSIQLHSSEKNKKEILLNFADSTKEQIIKIFSIIHERIKEFNLQLQFLNEEKLETRFLAPIFGKLDSNISVTNKSESLLITQNQNVQYLDSYRINVDLIENRTPFIPNFLNLINSFKRIGYLIFNFKIGFDNNVKFNPYFVEIRENHNKEYNLLQNVNNFFNVNLLKRHTIKIKDIYKLMWRLEIVDEMFQLNHFNDLFFKDDNNGDLGFLKFINQIKQKLNQNEIEFIELDKKLLFIEQKYLFLVLKKLDCDYIYRLIEKHHSKYLIYITILHELDHKKLLEIKEISQLENIRIFNPNDIQGLNFKIFKSEMT